MTAITLHEMVAVLNNSYGNAQLCCGPYFASRPVWTDGQVAGVFVKRHHTAWDVYQLAECVDARSMYYFLRRWMRAAQHEHEAQEVR